MESLYAKMDRILEEVKGEKSDKMASKGGRQLEEVPAALAWMKHCRSMQDVLDAGFDYDEYGGTVTFKVCIDGYKPRSCFHYSASDGLQFDEDEYLPREFSTFKRNIIRHIETSKSQ